MPWDRVDGDGGLNFFVSFNFFINVLLLKSTCMSLVASTYIRILIFYLLLFFLSKFLLSLLAVHKLNQIIPKYE